MERRNTKALVTYILIINSFISSIHGHGRLIDPPGRASMWRYGFNTPVDYNDNQLFCGGYNVCIRFFLNFQDVLFVNKAYIIISGIAISMYDM